MAGNNGAKNKTFVCDCEGTMSLDWAKLEEALGAENFSGGHTQLCRAQLDRLVTGAKGADQITVACTQEHQTFAEALIETGQEIGLETVNIRERAGWSSEAGKAMPKIAALLKDASHALPDTGTVEMRSEGVCLIYGKADAALEAARRLDGRLNVSVLLSDPSEAVPLGNMDLMIATGRIQGARGHLGDFEINVARYSAIRPSSRDAFNFDLAQDGAASTCDLILDVSGGAPLFPHPDRRDGYYQADPSDPAALHRVLFDIADMVGEFEKPRYVSFNADLCAHSRSRVTGCSRCLDVCPAGAITPDGDTVAIDPYLCGGCGACNSVCPTGAASYSYPPTDGLSGRAKALLAAFGEAGGKAPVLMVHDGDHGSNLIEAMARHGRGLPARVLPLAVNEVSQIGADFLLSALAHGAERVTVLASRSKQAELTGLAEQLAIVEAMMSGLGYDSGKAFALIEDDPDVVENTLFTLPKPKGKFDSSGFLPQSEKRLNIRLAAQHLKEQAPAPVDVVALAPGAPFGTVDIDVDGCTLCFACVSACPTGALGDNPDSPRLSFQESACIQCGLCRNTCPEKVISLAPQFDFREEAADHRVIKEEEPFECVSCGKPFATKSTINKMVEELSGKHWMFQGDAAERLKMCEDCRVVAQFHDTDRPFKFGERPVPRTTDDYLSGNAGDDEDGVG